MNLRGHKNGDVFAILATLCSGWQKKTNDIKMSIHGYRPIRPKLDRSQACEKCRLRQRHTVGRYGYLHAGFAGFQGFRDDADKRVGVFQDGGNLVFLICGGFGNVV